MVEVDDADAARAFVERALDQDSTPRQPGEYAGHSVLQRRPRYALGVINDQALVVGTETAFRVAVDAAAGQSLGESERVFRSGRRRSPTTRR